MSFIFIDRRGNFEDRRNTQSQQQQQQQPHYAPAPASSTHQATGGASKAAPAPAPAPAVVDPGHSYEPDSLFQEVLLYVPFLFIFLSCVHVRSALSPSM